MRPNIQNISSIKFNNTEYNNDKIDKIDDPYMNYYINHTIFRTQNIIDSNNITLKNTIIEYLSDFKENLVN